MRIVSGTAAFVAAAVLLGVRSPGAEPAASDAVRMPSERELADVLGQMYKQRPAGLPSLGGSTTLFGSVQYSAPAPDVPRAFRSEDRTEAVFPGPVGDLPAPGAPSVGTAGTAPGQPPQLEVTERYEDYGNGALAFQLWTLAAGGRRPAAVVKQIRGVRDQTLLIVAAATHPQLEAACRQLFEQRDAKQATVARQVGRVSITLHVEKPSAGDAQGDRSERRWVLRDPEPLSVAEREAVAARLRYALNYRCPHSIREVVGQAQAVGAEQIARDTLLAAQRHANGRVGIRATYGLWRVTGARQETVAQLLGSLGDAEAANRVEAVTALEEFVKDEASVSQALLHALRDADPAVRCTAALQLGGAGNHDAAVVQTLTAALAGEDSSQRVLAVCGLGHIGPDAKTSLPALRAFAEKLSEQEPWPLVDTAEALWRIGRDAPAALACLAKVQQSEDDKARFVAGQLKEEITRAAREPN